MKYNLPTKSGIWLRHDCIWIVDISLMEGRKVAEIRLDGSYRFILGLHIAYDCLPRQDWIQFILDEHKDEIYD